MRHKTRVLALLVISWLPVAGCQKSSPPAAASNSPAAAAGAAQGPAIKPVPAELPAVVARVNGEQVNRAELASLKGVVDAMAIRRQARRHIGRLQELSRHAAETFCGLMRHRRQETRDRSPGGKKSPVSGLLSQA